MNENDNSQFTAHLLDAVDQAKKLGYPANEFKKMLNGEGGFATVKKIVAKKHPSDGFMRLQSLGRLDLSCEAIIVETRWREFFDDDLLELAEDRLRSVGYPFASFSTPTSTPSNQHEVGALPSDADAGPRDEFVPPADDGRERELRSVVVRPGQGKFRDSLMLHYRPNCSISGCTVKPALQAAHIVAYRGQNSDHVQNGLVLRADLHSLFDNYLFSIEPDDLRIVLSEVMKMDPHYRAYDGAQMFSASPRLPSRNALRVHWDTFRSA